MRAVTLIARPHPHNPDTLFARPLLRLLEQQPSDTLAAAGAIDNEPVDDNAGAAFEVLDAGGMQPADRTAIVRDEEPLIGLRESLSAVSRRPLRS